MRNNRRRRVRNAAARARACFLDSDVSDDAADDDDFIDDEDDDDPPIIVRENVDEDDDESDNEAVNPVVDAIAGPHEDLKAPMLREMAENGFVPAYYGEETAKANEPLNPYEGQPYVGDEAMRAAKSMKPIDLFFFFLPKKLWRLIASETNRYEMQTREERVRIVESRCKRTMLGQGTSEKCKEAVKKIRAFEAIYPHEILIVIGLLVARSLCPMKMGLEQHWSSMPSGAIPAGTWSSYMPRQRFRDITRFLHFSDNKHPLAKKDRAWKIRRVVETVQDTFARGMTIGRWIAFDEMVIPSRSSRNAVRIYLKNKPHKYGTKLFAVCCGETNYCARVDVYCGARQDKSIVDCLSGAAAVLRNLKALFPPSKVDRRQMRVVVTDREYTCVTLAVRLLMMGFCSIGTALPSRLGFPKQLKLGFKNVPKDMANKRGLCNLMQCSAEPNLFACNWLDNKPVYFLACGVATWKTSIIRREKNGSSVDVSCPQFVADYNKYMNGVDAHDQLRLQRYSVQRSLRWKKYYKTLFFGLVDMALVNAYIVHCQYCKSIGEKPMSHPNFRLALHEQLINLTSDDMRDAPTPASSTTCVGSSPFAGASVTTHQLEVCDDKQPSGRQKYRVCKVCSILQTDPQKPVSKSKAYCVQCSTEKTRVYLCDRNRRTIEGNHMTCFQIWHQLWRNGTKREGGRRIRMRAIATRADPSSDAMSVSTDYSF